MRKLSRALTSVLTCFGLLVGAAGAAPGPLPGAAELSRMNARFAPVDISADVSALDPHERRALARLVAAAQVLDGVILRQLWAGDTALLADLVGGPGHDDSPLGRARLQEFLLNRGPWSELDRYAPFLPGVPEHPPGANFYPPGVTKAEIESWLRGLPEAERQRALGFFTTIRRGPDGKFMIVPYSVEYQGELAVAAARLREAAAETRDARLRTFLEKRAAALLSNEYGDSDVAWMELDGDIEPTFGPYEVYNDEWFNAKASFEAYITVRDRAETEKLQRLSARLQEIEDHLPIEPGLRNPRLGALAPIRVVNSIFSAGDGNRGVQTAAYNLPNDERIVHERGSKRVMLKNVQEAKFRTVLLPIARAALSAADQRRVSFDAFFTHILMHELMHGLGPHHITAGNKRATVREALQEHYSAIEEAKADISGLFAMQRLIDEGVLDRGVERTMYTTYLASAFRTIRFGIGEAHGKGIALQINYLLDAGGYRVNPDGTFGVDEGKIKGAVQTLTTELMTLQGHGDRARAADLMKRLAVVRPPVQRVLDRLGKVPVDIAPRYVTAARLVAEVDQPGAARPPAPLLGAARPASP